MPRKVNILFLTDIICISRFLSSWSNQKVLREILISYKTCIVTSPEYAWPSTVCSDPLLFSQPKWKWSCSSLYTLFPRGPPVSFAVPSCLEIVKVGAWPLLVNVPLTFPNMLSNDIVSPFRFEFRDTVEVLMFIGDWALPAQSGAIFLQSSVP